METATTLTEIEEPTSSLVPEDDTLDDQQPNILHEETIHLIGLTYKDREFVFNHEMPVRVTWDGRLWDYESEIYNIEGFAENKQEAELSFKDDFVGMWKHVGSDDTDKMTKDAKELRLLLRYLVKTERHIDEHQTDTNNKTKPDH